MSNALPFYFDPPSAPSYLDSNYSKFANVPPEIVEDVASGRNEIIRQQMDEHEARVCLILDVSASMQNPNGFFQDPIKGNQVQMLINKALALAFLFDDNQMIEVFPFGDDVFPPIVLNHENFTNATELVMHSIGGQFRTTTNYAAPIKAVREYYFNDKGKRNVPQKCDEPPVFAIFITDGEPNVKKTEAMNEFISASHQAIFFKFVALKGKQTDTEFTYLQSIDDHDVKDSVNRNSNDGNLFYMDNSDLVVLNNPDELTMEKLIHEYRGWLIEAWDRHLLQHDPKVGKLNHHEGRVVSNYKQPQLQQSHSKDHRGGSCYIL